MGMDQPANGTILPVGMQQSNLEGCESSGLVEQPRAGLISTWCCATCAHASAGRCCDRATAVNAYCGPTSMLYVEVVQGGFQQLRVIRKAPGDYQLAAPGIAETCTTPILQAARQARQQLQELASHPVELATGVLRTTSPSNPCHVCAEGAWRSSHPPRHHRDRGSIASSELLLPFQPHTCLISLSSSDQEGRASGHTRENRPSRNHSSRWACVLG